MKKIASRVLFLYGNDEFAISRRISEIQTALDKDGMNTAHLDARAVSADELNMAVNAMPFLAERRLVFLEKPSARYVKPSQRKEFIAFLEKAPASALLVLLENLDDKKAPKHWLTRWAQGAKDFAKAERFMLPRVWKTDEWVARIQAETRAQGGEIEAQAAARLVEMAGQNTRQAAQEITKLLTYVNFARPVTLADVELVSVNSAQGDIFALVDALGGGDGQAAQAMLHRLLEEQDAFSIFGMIVRQFRLLLLAREALDAGENVRQTLKVHDFVAKKIGAQARKFSIRSLEAIYRHLLKLDEQAKTGKMELALGLDMFVLALAGRR